MRVTMIGAGYVDLVSGAEPICAPLAGIRNLAHAGEADERSRVAGAVASSFPQSRHLKRSFLCASP